MIAPFGIPARRGPVVWARREEETSPAAATFARRAAHRAGVDLRIGRTPASSARTARELDATMIIISAVPDRWAPHHVSARKASSLIAHAGCAVVSVAPTLAVLPRVCVAAMDFSPASIRAVQLALLIIEDCGTLTLVHVRPANDLSSAQHTARSARTSDEIADRFTRLAVQLRDFAPPGVVIETQMESGEVVDQVLSVAREVDAQLIAIGVHAARMRNRIVDYGFAADTLRRASCSVLASPATRVARVFRDDNESHYWTTAPDESESESVVPG